MGQHQQCTWRNALEIKPNIWSEPFDRAIGEDDGGEDTVGLTRFYWILSSNPAILVEISTRITEFEERIQ